ncbi:isocitrate lyase/phosphoenolpyruvate mutase family protein, partial [Salmonella enterica]|uniref:isocitrate lyase/phosphoenolpyruvate mutase family protein n=1 Tax=Salmonella enterica TaxID=28901 RepID=UPI003D2E2D0C
REDVLCFDKLRTNGPNEDDAKTGREGMIIDKARAFAALHVPGKPLILFNAWDAGSARVVAEAGAAAIVTGSWSVAAAHGLFDAEA